MKGLKFEKLELPPKSKAYFRADIAPQLLRMVYLLPALLCIGFSLSISSVNLFHTLFHVRCSQSNITKSKTWDDSSQELIAVMYGH